MTFPVLKWFGPSVTLRTVSVHPSPFRSVRLSSTVWAHPPNEEIEPIERPATIAHAHRFMGPTIGHARPRTKGAGSGRVRIVARFPLDAAADAGHLGGGRGLAGQQRVQG